MSFARLLRRNLVRDRLPWLAVVCCVAVIASIVGGSLLVGKSVRSSLRRLAFERLSSVDHVLAGDRFFREDLAAELRTGSSIRISVAPALVLTGSITAKETTEPAPFAPHVSVYGVDERFWDLVPRGETPSPGAGQVVLDEQTAKRLNVRVGDEVSLALTMPSAMPRDAPLGRRTGAAKQLTLTLSAIAPMNSAPARFRQRLDHRPPCNAFVSLRELQSQLGIARTFRTRRQSVPRPARVNAIFIHSLAGRTSQSAADILTARLSDLLALEDLSLRLVDRRIPGYVSLESDRILLEPDLAATAMAAAHTVSDRVSPVLVALAAEIRHASRPEARSAFPFVAGIPAGLVPPFGPFELNEGSTSGSLENDQAYLTSWGAEDLQAEQGDQVVLTTFSSRADGTAPRSEHSFQVAGVVPMTGPGADRGFNLHWPGITDVDSVNALQRIFPALDQDVAERDLASWKEHHAAPRMFISLEAAQAIWKSRHGHLTAIRMAPNESQPLADLRRQFTQRFLSQVDAPSLGMTVQPVKFLGKLESPGAIRFAWLLLALSAVPLLMSLLFIVIQTRWNAEARQQEFAILQAVGLTPRRLRRLLLMEGAIVSLAGAAVGLLGAVGFASLILAWLNGWQGDSLHAEFLKLSFSLSHLVIGAIVSGMAALCCMGWVNRSAPVRSLRPLLQQSEMSIWPAPQASPWIRFPWGAVIVGILLAFLVPLATIPGTGVFTRGDWAPVAFFIAGCAGLAAVIVVGDNWRSLAQRRRQPAADAALEATSVPEPKSERTIGQDRSRLFQIVAAALFGATVVSALRQGEQGASLSESGGFTLVAQSDTPILFDLNSPQGRNLLGMSEAANRAPELSESFQAYACRFRPGDESTLLNWYRVRSPAILGLPKDLVETLAEPRRLRFASATSRDPWRSLAEETPDGAIPVFGDRQLLTNRLQVRLGDRFPAPSTAKGSHSLQVQEILHENLLQGMLLMSEENFLKLFPDVVGARFFLIDVPADRAQDVRQTLNAELRPFGFQAEPTGARLHEQRTLRNALLTLFQALSLAGICGGAILLTLSIRRLWDRRHAEGGTNEGDREAVLRALQAMAGGAIAGVVTGLIAVGPFLPGSDAAWGTLAFLLMAIFISVAAALFLRLRSQSATTG